jgi:hypothetical protein
MGRQLRIPFKRYNEDPTMFPRRSKLANMPWMHGIEMPETRRYPSKLPRIKCLSKVTETKNLIHY